MVMLLLIMMKNNHGDDTAIAVDVVIAITVAIALQYSTFVCILSSLLLIIICPSADESSLRKERRLFGFGAQGSKGPPKPSLTQTTKTPSANCLLHRHSDPRSLNLQKPKLCTLNPCFSPYYTLPPLSSLMIPV